MGDRGPEMKPEEQYPLLKTDGGGDSPPTQAALPPGWGVQYTTSRKASWVSRWPEFMSACWMTLILVGISFLVFYAMGMGAYRRQQFVFIKCNGSRPASNVFYHHLVQRGAQVPFLRYSEYLANMASQYPNLQFNVFFLIDDSFSSRGPRSNRLINKLMPSYPYGSYSYKTNENNLQALVEFQRRYQNVNISVMPLSMYMTSTPLRFKWRTMPTAYLPFYARVFSVWKNGGVGIDLALNSVYEDSLVSRRKAAILQQHNDGIVPEAYANALNRIDKEEGSAVFAMFCGMVNRFVQSFMNRTLTNSPMSTEPIQDTLIRNHRAKREASNDSANEATALPVVTSSVNNLRHENISAPIFDLPKLPFDLLNKLFGVPSNMTDDIRNDTDAPAQVVMVYDFRIVSDSIGPSYIASEPLATPEFGPAVRSGEVKTSHLLSIDGEGMFIAASSRLHPFLGHLITAGCQRMAPKFAIQDAFITQCSGSLREDVYCNNIYLL